jgi:hypothetical protein
MTEPNNARPPAAVTALYVDVRRGPCASMRGVYAWGEERDATQYAGPWPVVAHPACGPWSRLSHFCGPALVAQQGHALLAVDQVRRWGGVLEHPAHSRLWDAAGLPLPYSGRDTFGGRSIEVEQWWWGHRAVKPTWLYIVGLRGPIPAMPCRPLEERPPSGGKGATARDPKLRSMLERLPKTQRHLTPPAFTWWLVDLAAQCGGQDVR